MGFQKLLIPKILRYMVSWKDGMKLNSLHFLKMENAIIDSLRDINSRQLNVYSNYGIVPSFSLNEDSIILNLEDNALVLDRCRAVMPGGTRVDFFADHDIPRLVCKLSSKKDLQSSRMWDIQIVVDPFKRFAFGSPEENSEKPARIPNATYIFDLDLQDSNSTKNSESRLTIGRLKVNTNEYELDSTYIPACTSVNSWKTLDDSFTELKKTLQKLNKSCVKVARKKYSIKMNPLAEDIIFLAECLRYPVADIYDYLRIIGSTIPPSIFYYNLLKVVRVVDSSLESMSESRKGSLLLYLDLWWKELTPGQFQKNIDKLLDLEFEQENLQEAFGETQEFILTLSGVLEELSKLNEYEFTKGKTIVITKLQKKPIINNRIIRSVR